MANHIYDELPDRQITVLFVEDDTAVRLALVMGLLHRNFKVLEAGDGDEAVAICASYEGTIDIVIADVIMPRMWGHEFAVQLQRLRPHTPLLYISGHSEEMLTNRKILSRGAAFLPKPFQAKGLAEKIMELLAEEQSTAAKRTSQ